jgi:hypothetical protein
MFMKHALVNSILLITWQFGWQRRAAYWASPLLTKPFVLMPGPAVGTIFIFALLLFLIRRFSLARQEETRLSTELASAHSIQRTLVPPISASFSGYDLNGLSLPSEKVGGDLVDVVLLPNRSVLAYVADVSGHGLQAGILMGMVKTAVRTILLESCDDPASVRSEIIDAPLPDLGCAATFHINSSGVHAAGLPARGRAHARTSGTSGASHHRGCKAGLARVTTSHQRPTGTARNRFIVILNKSMASNALAFVG